MMSKCYQHANYVKAAELLKFIEKCKMSVVPHPLHSHIPLLLPLHTQASVPFSLPVPEHSFQLLDLQITHTYPPSLIHIPFFI